MPWFTGMRPRITAQAESAWLTGSRGAALAARHGGREDEPAWTAASIRSPVTESTDHGPWDPAQHSGVTEAPSDGRCLGVTKAPSQRRDQSTVTKARRDQGAV